MQHFYVWGNHHCSDAGDFQEIFTDLSTNQSTLPKPLFHVIEKLDNQAISGLKDNLNFQPTLLVIIAGDNNIKEGDSIPDLIQHFIKLYETFSQYPLLEVVTCGLIPEKNPSLFESQLLNTANSRVRELQLSFTGSFVDVNGILIPEKDYYVFDDSLNPRGSRKLARLILDHILKRFPNFVKSRSRPRSK